MKAPKVAVAFLFVLLGSRNVAGQSTPAQAGSSGTAERVQTASIYITASTKKGVLIRDVKPEDITITEEKAPAKIEKVSCGRPEPLLVGVLVDVSGSRLSDSHLLSHYGDLETFLNKLLAKGDGTYLVAYDYEVHKLSEVVTDPPGISTAFDKLRKREPRGSTALYDAIKAAASANFKGRSGRRILVVVGDWEDNCSHVLNDEALRAAQRTSTTIYGILDSDNGIQSKKSHRRAVEVATEITEQTGGKRASGNWGGCDRILQSGIHDNGRCESKEGN